MEIICLRKGGMPHSGTRRPPVGNKEVDPRDRKDILPRGSTPLMTGLREGMRSARVVSGMADKVLADLQVVVLTPGREGRRIRGLGDYVEFLPGAPRHRDVCSHHATKAQVKGRWINILQQPVREELRVDTIGPVVVNQVPQSSRVRTVHLERINPTVCTEEATRSVCPATAGNHKDRNPEVAVEGVLPEEVREAGMVPLSHPRHRRQAV